MFFKAKSCNNLRYILVSTLSMDKNIKYTLYYVLINLSFGFCYQSATIYNGKLNYTSRQSHYMVQ